MEPPKRDLETGGFFSILGGKMDKDKLNKMRHSCEHVLTMAVLKLYPGIKMAMGPATDDGFYFDFDEGSKLLREDDFGKIEKEMAYIITADLPINHEEVEIDKAREIFIDNEYKLEWIKEIEDRGEKKVDLYRIADFVDLCSGPHVESTGKIGPFKLLSVAGAYWRGDEKNKMLKRIYGTCFEDKKSLERYLWVIEEAKKRDHKKLGKELDLFLIDESVGVGLPIILPKGNVIIKELQKYIRGVQEEKGYQEIISPHVGKKSLWETSGHWQHYREFMYPVMKVEKEDYLIKTMNCPFHILVYKNKKRSYRELPFKVSEFATVYRYEKSGELNGLLRVREITQDDGHIFCKEDQLENEIWEVVEMTINHFKRLKMNDYVMRLSLRDKKKKDDYLGEDKVWDMAETALRKVLIKNKVNYFEGVGEAAFYGPKIDPIVKDVLGREWQFGTIQVDFMLTERFDLKYVDKDGKEKSPVMIHRAPMGSFERTLGVLIEHFGGAFPCWLAPVQIKIMPISEKQIGWAKELGRELRKNGLRVEIDDKNEPIGAKIRNGEMEKIPYMLIVGKREEEKGVVSVRKRGEKDLGVMNVNDFIARIKEDVAKCD